MRSLKTLFGLAFVIAVIYISWQLLPPYFSNYQLQDDITTIARFSGPTNRPEDDIRNDILKKALFYDIKLKPQQVKISREGIEVVITVKYSVTVTFIGGKTYEINFEDASENKAKNLTNN